jgi:hypothetical protein
MIVPAFASRDLGGLAGPDGAEWALRNGLHARWPHNHAMTRHPRERSDRPSRLVPDARRRALPPQIPSDYNWQPNFAHPAVVAEAARYSINRFDQLPATLAADKMPTAPIFRIGIGAIKYPHPNTP